VNNATEITSVELKQRLDRGDTLKIVDVASRTSTRSTDRGLGADSARRRAQALHELDPTTKSSSTARWAAERKAADFLRSLGLQAVLNLKGGILDWIDKVDPTQPKY
jgi:adenylyltransferase/sulfurtransferase